MLIDPELIEAGARQLLLVRYPDAGWPLSPEADRCRADAALVLDGCYGAAESAATALLGVLEAQATVIVNAMHEAEHQIGAALGGAR